MEIGYYKLLDKLEPIIIRGYINEHKLNYTCTYNLRHTGMCSYFHHYSKLQLNKLFIVSMVRYHFLSYLLEIKYLINHYIFLPIEH